MKYEIHLTKLPEVKPFECFADNPREAIRMAREANPGFIADNATELLDEDEIGKTFEVIGGCESCGQMIFDGEKYEVMSDEGPTVCGACLAKVNTEAQAPQT